MARSKNGEAIGANRKSPEELACLNNLAAEAAAANDLDVWRRARAVVGYIAGETVIALASSLSVTRGAINRWLQWYNAEGAEGLRTGKAPGAPSRLSAGQMAELTTLIEAGPLSAGYTSGLWTGPMIRDLIQQRFQVTFHCHYVPALLHKLGFSVQRPRKRLARADPQAQATWLNERLPEIKKKPQRRAAS